MSTAALVLDIVSALLLAVGAILVVLSAVGLLRLRDVFTRVHAASLAETGGVLLIMIGLLLQAQGFADAIRLVLLTLLLLITSPLSSHALLRAAQYDGLRPNLSQADDPDRLAEDSEARS